MNHTTTEQGLAKACASGKAGAQKALYDQYVADMMMICLRYIPNRQDAQEVMLDGFYNCFKNIGGFTHQGPGSLRAWLSKIMVNQCLMHLRKRPAIIAEDLDMVDVGMDNVMLEELTAKEILQMIHELPDGYRTVFNLYFFEGKTHKEIAGLLGISENTSKSQLFKAKSRLQDMLSEHY